MGIYYQVACDELKERIDPGSIDNLGIKAGSIAHPKHPFGQVVIFALLTRWFGKSIRLVDDIVKENKDSHDEKAHEEVQDHLDRVKEKLQEINDAHDRRQ